MSIYPYHFVNELLDGKMSVHAILIRRVALFISLSSLRIPSSHFVKGGLCYSGLILLDPWLFGDMRRELSQGIHV